MEAFLLDRYAKGARLRRGTVADPVPGDTDLLVEVHAAGVNPLDTKIRDGEFKQFLPYRMPLILGNDVAGIVRRVGPGVRRFKAGDAVYARPDDDRIGSFAQLIALAEADAAPIPAGLDMNEAASLPLVALTAWQALVERAELRPGQKVLIHAGSGGVGTIAIQLAKHLGATVATTVSARHAALVRELGADVVIDYASQDFTRELSGYDVVFNSLGPDILARSLDVLKPGGKLISIAGPPDPAFAREAGLGWVLRQVVRVLSFGIRRKARRRGVDYSFLLMRADGAQLAEITALVEAGAIRPVIDRVFPFAQVNEALAAVETGRSRGKVVVAVKDPAS